MSTFTLGLVIADLKQLGESTHYKDDNGNNIGENIIDFMNIRQHTDTTRLVQKSNGIIFILTRATSMGSSRIFTSLRRD